ncbi:glycosyl hydrolase family 18 protein [Cellulomonas sp. NPDC058312]|uniref:glycosyl hydrolase family 18 protein n=1 Tax=Cellulomonas sp. NPDC058312 TaxID=3346441 RepID=UPI0036E01545
MNIPYPLHNPSGRARCLARRGLGAAIISSLALGSVLAAGASAASSTLVADDTRNVITGMTAQHMWSTDGGASWSKGAPDLQFKGTVSVVVAELDSTALDATPYVATATYATSNTLVTHNGSIWSNKWYANPGEAPGSNDVWTLVKKLDTRVVGSFEFTPWSGATATAFQADSRRESIEQKKIVGYFPEWGIYEGHRNYMVPDIPMDKITHLNYGFALLKQDTQGEWYLGIADPWAALPDGGGHDLYGKVAKATAAAGVENMLSIGGWTNSENGEFEAATATEAKSDAMAQKMVDFMVEHGFTGLDIDWEYPSDAQGGVQFERLISQVKAKLTALGKANDDYYPLTIAVSPNHTKMPFIHPEAMIDLVDAVNVMTYDYHGAFDPVTGHNAPLSAGSLAADQKFSLEGTLKEFHEVHGIPKNQLLVGVPYYGRGWGDVEPTELIPGLPGLGAPGTATVQGAWDDAGLYTGSNPWYVLKDMEQDPAFTKYWDDEAQVPYLYNASTKQFFTYDDPRSVQAKVDFIKKNNYGGAIIWDLSGDTRDQELGSIVAQVLDTSTYPEPEPTPEPEPEPEPEPTPEPEPEVPAAGVPYATASTARIPSGVVLGDGTATHTLSVILKDANGDAVTGLAGAKFPAEVKIAGVDAKIGAFKESGSGMYYAYVSSTQAGTANITVSLDGTVIGAPVFAEFSQYVPGKADKSKSSIRVTSDSKLADGKQAHNVTVILKDASGKAVTGQAAQLPVDVTFKEKVGTTSVATDKLTTGTWKETSTKGTYELPVTSTTQGTFVVYGHLNGSQIPTGTSGFTYGPAATGVVDTTQSTSRIASGTVLGDGTATHTVTVTLKDAAGNPVTGLAGAKFPATTTLSGSGAKVGAFIESGAKGTYYAYITSTKPGVVSVDVTLGGKAIGATNKAEFSEYVPGQADRSKSSTKVLAGSKLADGRDAHTIVVNLKDASGKIVTGKAGSAMPVTIKLSGAQGAATTGLSVSPFVETSVKGTYEAKVTSTTAGTFHATGHLGTGQVPVSGTAMSFLDSKVG